MSTVWRDALNADYRLAICARGELLVNAPVFVVDFIDPALKQTINRSRYPEYNSNEYQTIIFAAAVSCGLRYEFGKSIRLPLDDGVNLLATRIAQCQSKQ